MAVPRIISMEFSLAGTDNSYFRILTGPSVKYITVKPGALDADSLMDMPLDFQNILPPLPYAENHWNSACVSRNAATGDLECKLSNKDLPGVQNIWHSKIINFLDIEKTQQLGLLAQECIWKQDTTTKPSERDDKYQQNHMIAKIARFPWEIQYIEAETEIYKLMENRGIAPQFLGHIHEGGRVIGFLLEKVEGRPAGEGDLNTCQQTLGRLHDLKILHGDCNRYNFVVCSDDKAILLDFETAKMEMNTEMLKEEMNTIEKRLSEDTDFGRGFIDIEE
ncbi:hypothetical protein AK830_g10545 [Neonectria ditissima]|uniref:Aminoglycoside phosphotransferase domain-containing protein n=1 Tax=Neonectria ditissima TaxID=78410 RepID=A0A0P7B6I4_9HYPO|nr:hypothetical protein AK830_g10545 [Neonectria ditissima]